MSQLPRVAGCFLEYQGKFLILLRQPTKSSGNTWGLPAGKVDQGETDEQAVIRETKEEVGYAIKSKDLQFLGAWQFEMDKTYIFPTFKVILDSPITVTLSPLEHRAYLWATPRECYARADLIPGFHQLLHLTGYIRE